MTMDLSKLLLTCLRFFPRYRAQLVHELQALLTYLTFLFRYKAHLVHSTQTLLTFQRFFSQREFLYMSLFFVVLAIIPCHHRLMDGLERIEVCRKKNGRGSEDNRVRYCTESTYCISADPSVGMVRIGTGFHW